VTRETSLANDDTVALSHDGMETLEIVADRFEPEDHFLNPTFPKNHQQRHHEDDR
jgi:hypothetical protein